MKSKSHNRSLWISALLFLGGIISWGAYTLIGSEVDAQGILHEPFALIPVGWLLIFVGLVVSISHWVKQLTRAHNTQ